MCELASQILGKKFTEDMITTSDIYNHLPVAIHKEFTEKWGQEGFCTAINVYNGAYEGITLLRQLAYVHFVTAPAVESKTWVYERGQWLKRIFNADPINDVSHTKRKEFVHGDMLIDDTGEIVTKWCEEHPNGIGVIWAHKRNERYEDVSFRRQHRYIRTNDWNHVCNLIHLL
jgi:5'(3')-deoxyribonucleotidase